MSDTGASISMHDKRLNKFLGWFWSSLGVAIVALLGIAARNLYDLNVTVARSIDSDIVRDARIQDHEQRLRQVERDLNTVEGRVYRGIEEATKEPQEVKRGK